MLAGLKVARHIIGRGTECSGTRQRVEVPVLRLLSCVRVTRNRYRRQLGGHLAVTATVLNLRSDLTGIPHVQFAVTVDGSRASHLGCRPAAGAVVRFGCPLRLSLQGSLSAQCREDRPWPRRRLDNDGAGHARADQHTFGNLIDMDAYRDTLGEPDPLEGRIGKELGAGRIVAIGDAAAYALDMAAQRRAAAHQINLGLFSRLYGRDFGFFEKPVTR